MAEWNESSFFFCLDGNVFLIEMMQHTLKKKPFHHHNTNKKPLVFFFRVMSDLRKSVRYSIIMFHFL